MKLFCIQIILILIFCAIAQTPSIAQDFYAGGSNPTDQIIAVIDWTSLGCFYLAIVYFGAFLALMLSRNYSFGLINLGVCVVAIVLMIAEPTFLNMVSMTGFKYSVKYTIQLSCSAVGVVAVLGCLFLPTICAFAKKSKWRILILPLNFVGIFVFPLFILSLYLVQTELNRKIKEGKGTQETGIDAAKLESSKSFNEPEEEASETSLDGLTNEGDIESSVVQMDVESKE